MSAPVLQVKDLRVYYPTPNRLVKAVDGVSFDIQPGERFGLVGESGSGKSTIAMAILRLIKRPGRITGGEIWLDGASGLLNRRARPNGNGQAVNLLKISDEQMRQLRLAGVSLIAQGAMNSLNPVNRIHTQLLDGLRDHGVHLSRREQEMKVQELLESVGLNRQVANMYPHELSGGMKQRVVTAIGISMRPKLIIADEPTSALDVIVQRQVIETLRHAQEAIQAAVLLIGHDMGLMAQSVHTLAVMRAGEIVELGSVEAVLLRPQHNYTRMLISSLPSLERKEAPAVVGESA